jgi:hypothetical protein
MHHPLRSLIACSLALALAPGATARQAGEPGFYSSKSPYRPLQDGATYQAPPAGFAPVFTQLVARHGSRGLSGVKYDMAMLNIWNQAAADGALTALGAQLGPDIRRLMRANALLGYGVDGVSKPGYGNLSRVGIGEHMQLAQRMRARLAPLFGQAGARRIVVVDSGVDRARDSASNFTRSLVAGSPALAALVLRPPAPAPYPAGAPLAQPDGTDRFTLHFHSLDQEHDLVRDAADPRYAVYQDSQAYQAYLDSAAYHARLAAIDTDPQARSVGRAVLERLFSKAFVDKIDNGTYKFSTKGELSFTSDDGKLTQTIKGKDKEAVGSLADAASMLYNLYIIAPGMRQDGAPDFDKYMPREAARHLGYLSDLETFYKEGPSFTESGGVTWKMAQGLQDDFFAEVDAIERGELGHLAKLRFAHAETIVPFVAGLGLEPAATPLPAALTYSYANNPWRGAQVAPMASNVQWDVLRNGAGKLLVRMLYNEQETPFKPACEGARIAAASYFYDYTRLKACHGRAAASQHAAVATLPEQPSK